MRVTIYTGLMAITFSILLSNATYGQDFAPQATPPAQTQEQPHAVGQNQQPPADALAVVNGDVITKREFEVRLRPHIEANPGLDAQTQQILQNQVMDGLIKERLVDQYVLEQVEKPEQEEVKQIIDQVKQQAETQGATYQQFLDAQGQTEEGMEKRIESSIAWQKFLQQQVSEPKLQEHFSENQERFAGKEFDEARQEVVQSYAMNLWQEVAERAIPEAEIQVVSPPQGAQQQQGGFPPQQQAPPQQQQQQHQQQQPLQ